MLGIYIARRQNDCGGGEQPRQRKKEKKTNQLSFDLSSTANNQHFVYLVKKIGAVQSMVNVMVYEYLSIYLVSIIHAFIIFLYNLIWFSLAKVAATINGNTKLTSA